MGRRVHNYATDGVYIKHVCQQSVKLTTTLHVDGEVSAVFGRGLQDDGVKTRAGRESRQRQRSEVRREVVCQRRYNIDAGVEKLSLLLGAFYAGEIEKSIKLGYVTPARTPSPDRPTDRKTICMTWEEASQSYHATRKTN